MTEADTKPTSQLSQKQKARRTDRRVKKAFLIVALLAVTVLLVRQYIGPALPYPAMKNLPEALSRARQEDRRLLVMVYGRWGGSAYEHNLQMLDKPLNRELFQRSGAIAVRLQPGAEGLEPYGIDKTPAMLWLAPDGSVIAHMTGRVAETEWPVVFQTPPMEFRNDADVALAEARQEDRPVLMLVTTRVRTKEVGQFFGDTLWQSDIRQALNEMDPIPVRVPLGDDLAIGVEPDQAPALLLLSPTGHELARITGELTAEAMREQILPNWPEN